uniref:Uncharacterized protein n=1 Tax=Rhizophora mucronata TaxID=61149 RepID=A0A2P2R407_RHIMU
MFLMMTFYFNDIPIFLAITRWYGEFQ